MGLFDRPRPATQLQGSAIDAILDELCSRHHPCLLATPYLSLELRLLAREGTVLKARTILSEGSSRHILAQRPLRLRLPWDLTMYAGGTEFQGFEQTGQLRTLRLQTPDTLSPDERRGAYRVERVGRSTATLSTLEGDILRANLENLSLSGVALFCLEPIPASGYQGGQRILVTLALEDGPHLTFQARIIQSEGQNLSLHFEPPPSLDQASQLSAWLEPRAKEARRRWESRFELRARAEASRSPGAQPSGVLLLTRNALLESEIGSALEGTQALRACPPVMGAYRSALATPPQLFLVEAMPGLDARHQIKTLLENLPPPCPLLVVGWPETAEDTRFLATELRADAHILWQPTQPLFFRRLVQGLIHRRWGRTHTAEG